MGALSLWRITISELEPDLVFQVGATGYLVSTMSCDAFVKSIELVMMGETVFPPGIPGIISRIPRASLDAKPRYPAKTKARSSSPERMRPRRNFLQESWQFCGV